MFDDTERNSFARPATANLLNIVVHTRSFENEILAGDTLIWRILELGRLDGIRVLWTPTESAAVASVLRDRQADVASCEESGEWLEVGSNLLPRFRDSLRYLGDWRRPAEPGSRVAIVDELFTRSYEVDLFVVAAGDPFLERDPRRRHYVAPDDLFELTRILLVSKGRFYLRSNYTVGENHYFDYRRRTLFPAVDHAIGIAGAVPTGPLFPAELSDRIHSIETRIELILRAADRIGNHALRRPDGRSPGRCAYHLSYLVMLATGLYDELAWTLEAWGQLHLKRHQVTLRFDSNRHALANAVAASDPHLHAFLTEPRTRNLIQLFYPARDQLQHRGMIAAELKCDPRPCLVVWNLPEETLVTIEAVSFNGGADWGMLDGQAAGYVEPHLFALAALKGIAEVANGVMRHLDWDAKIAKLPPHEQTRVQTQVATRDRHLTYDTMRGEPRAQLYF